MRSKLQLASGIAVAGTMLTALLGAAGSVAFAEDKVPAIVTDVVQTQFISTPVVQQLPSEALRADAEQAPDAAQMNPRGATLAAHVEAQPAPGALDSEMHCLAGTIYFESRGESLDGQLAVARVVIERTASRRFPDSYCGVVFQRSQFSFVRGKRMPTIRTSSPAWRRAVAVAKIAHEGSWNSPTEGALFFHAAHVSPGWRLKRLARIDNHIFYR